MTVEAPREVAIYCQRGHFLVAVPPGTPYRAYCHRCQKSESGAAKC